MPKNAGDFTPEQIRAIEKAPAELTNGAIVGMAQAGDLDVPSFHPSKATVQRIRQEARDAGRIGPEPEPTAGDTYRKLEAKAFGYLHEMAEEVEEYRAEHGKHNSVLVKNYCQALRTIGQNLPKRDVRGPEQDVSTPDTQPKPTLLARLASTSSTSSDTDSGDDGRASTLAQGIDAPRAKASLSA